MSQAQRRKAETLSRAELVELAKYCGMPGASNNFESPYRNRQWICANLPVSLFGSSSGSQNSKTTSYKARSKKQRGGQLESEGAKATMAAIASGSSGGTSGALASLSEEVARRARISTDVSLDLPPLPEIPNIPIEGQYVPGTGRRLKYCATNPPTLPLEIGEEDPSYKEIFEALYPPKIGTYAPLPEIPGVPPGIPPGVPPGIPPGVTPGIPPGIPSRPLPTIPEGPLPSLPEAPEAPVPVGFKLSEGAKATLIAMQKEKEPYEPYGPYGPYGLLPLSPPPSVQPITTPSVYQPLPLIPKGPEGPEGPEGPIIPEAIPAIQKEADKKLPVPKKKRTKKLPKKPCATGFYMDDQSGLCLEVMKTCPAVADCKAELESLGLKQKEAEKLLDSVKEDLISCQSSSAGWKQIEADLKSINLTKEEVDRILVSIGKHLSARIRAGENLDSLLDRIQKTLDQSAETVAALPPVAAQEFALVTGTIVAPPPMPVPKANSTKITAVMPVRSPSKPSAAELQGVQLRKVTSEEKKSTQKDLESTLQAAVLQNPAFIARRQAIEGTQSEGQWAA
jgi:hypothetical protein